MIQVRFSRTADAGGPSEFVLNEDCDESGIWIGDGMVRPDFQPRKYHAPDSPHQPGKSLLAVVLEQAELQVPLRIRSATESGIEAIANELEEAVWQFVYTTTLHVDGVEQSWMSEPAVPVWGPIQAIARKAHTRVGAVSIALNP